MKNQLVWILFVLAGVFVVTGSSKRVSAHISSLNQAMIRSNGSMQAVPTPVPTVSASLVATDAQESREIPPVGRNAGLVIGASVLVLIIISGVLGTRRREKH